MRAVISSFNITVETEKHGFINVALGRYNEHAAEIRVQGANIRDFSGTIVVPVGAEADAFRVLAECARIGLLALGEEP